MVGGIGTGLVYKAGATMAGTGIISRIIQQRTGIPLSQIYLWVDGGIVILAGIIFGWEIALYAMLTLLLHGMASNYVLEGPTRARTATIVTNRPETCAGRSWRIWAARQLLGRGRGYSGEPRTILMCTFYRPNWPNSSGPYATWTRCVRKHRRDPAGPGSGFYSNQ